MDHNDLRSKARDFMTKDAVEEFKQDSLKQQQRQKHGLVFKGATDAANEEKVDAFIKERRTWRESVPLLRSMEYWRLRADFYPYIQQSDSYDDFFIRGVSCHPRLSEYPMCKNVIQDYFVCRDSNKFLQMFNACTPLREQMASCINVVFVKNHMRGDKKFNANRDTYFEAQREKKVAKLMEHVAIVQHQKDKLQD